MSGECTIVLSDTQIPLHDKRAMSAFYDMVKDRENMFAKLFQIGDMFNLDSVSRWNDGTPAESGVDLQRELDSGIKFLEDVGKAYGGPKEYIMGNHDDRLHSYTGRKAHGLHGIKALDFETLTGTRDYGWVCKPQPYRVRPDTIAVHGMSVRSRSGYTATAHVDRFHPLNVVHGHTHRAGTVWRTSGMGARSWGMEVGHMMDERQATYGMGFDWQKGFGVLWHDGNKTLPEFVPVDRDGSFRFDGLRWKP